MVKFKKAVPHFKGKVKFAAVFVAASVLFSSSALVQAANGGAGDKAINLHGYMFQQAAGTTPNEIIIYFDKAISGFNQGMIKVRDLTDSYDVHITATQGSGGGWTHDGQSGGASIIVKGDTTNYSTDNTINNSTEYQVTVSGCLSSNNTYHWLVGSYLAHHDISFNVYTPDASGNYNNHTPQFSNIPISSGQSGYYAPGESENPTIICDMPFDQISTSLINPVLTESNVSSYVYLEDANGNAIPMDNDFTSNDYSSSFLGFTTQMNDAKTCIFIPLTLGGSSTANYNFATNTSYRLKVPSAISAWDITFTTGAETPASLGATQPTITKTSTTTTITWNNITSSVYPYGHLPDSYKIYYSTTSPYFGFDNCLGTYTYNQQPTDTETVNIPASGTVYYRITSVYSGQEGGFSLFVS